MQFYPISGTFHFLKHYIFFYFDEVQFIYLFSALASGILIQGHKSVSYAFFCEL